MFHNMLLSGVRGLYDLLHFKPVVKDCFFLSEVFKMVLENYYSSNILFFHRKVNQLVNIFQVFLIMLPRLFETHHTIGNYIRVRDLCRDPTNIHPTDPQIKTPMRD